ncbi:hypothetical protein Vretifemale_13033 [Volvox reticuliferus]|uniref:Uncharacterized protein n=1 Tax=Volvox reticuliferus TaxID=1737510 RepID=A0A8J4CPW2_9CHLO|nr:hypothetical protein Vretifemale_13033 [Volvox reticuliferus]
MDVSQRDIKLSIGLIAAAGQRMFNSVGVPARYCPPLPRDTSAPTRETLCKLLTMHLPFFPSKTTPHHSVQILLQQAAVVAMEDLNAHRLASTRTRRHGHCHQLPGPQGGYYPKGA